MSSNAIVTSRRSLHPKESAAASDTRSRAQTKAKNPKNHLLYKNLRMHFESGNFDSKGCATDDQTQVQDEPPRSYRCKGPEQSLRKCSSHSAESSAPFLSASVENSTPGGRGPECNLNYNSSWLSARRAAHHLAASASRTCAAPVPKRGPRKFRRISNRKSASIQGRPIRDRHFDGKRKITGQCREREGLAASTRKQYSFSVRD